MSDEAVSAQLCKDAAKLLQHAREAAGGKPLSQVIKLGLWDPVSQIQVNVTLEHAPEPQKR